MSQRLFISVICLWTLAAMAAFAARVSFEPVKPKKEPTQLAAVVKLSPKEKLQDAEPARTEKDAESPDTARTPDNKTAKDTGTALDLNDPNAPKLPDKVSQEEKPSGATAVTGGKPAVLSIEGQLTDEPSLRVVGKKLNYVVTVTWRGDVDLSAPEAPSLNGLQWVNSRTQDEVAGTGVVKRQYLFELKALAEGPAQIGKVKIYYTDKASGTQNSIEAAPVDFEINPAPRDMRPVALVIGICILLIGAAGGTVIALVLWRRRQKAREEVAAPEPTPLDKLRGGLEELNRMMIEGGGKEMFSLLAKRMREFLTLTENEPMNNWTTDQIGARLNAQEPPRSDRGRILDVLEKCDEVRYAAHQPTRDECESAMRDWKALLEAAGTKGTPAPNQKP